MVDIATLTYSVDSSGLAAAERALDSQAKAADRTSEAAENLENRYQAIARRGMEYAETMRQGNVSERAQAEAAREAALGIDTKARVMQGAGTQAERMAQRVEAMRVAEEREARIAAESARQKALQDVNLRKLLGSIDPTIAKLERLGQMEGNLERALDAGAISPEIFDQYQAKIDATRAATLNMGKAQDIATASIGKLNLNTVEAQQSVASLARAMASGQWGMATSSITSLTARTGAMGGMFSMAGLALGGLVAGLGLFIVQAGRGYAESRRMEGVMIGMGDATGTAAGEMLALRNEIGRATGDFKGATEAINQLALSGKVAGDTLESVAKAATNMARLTGQSVGTVTGEIQALADGGSEALIKLNDKYSFLTISTWENIEAIRAQDGEMAALAETARQLERVSQDRTDKMVEHAGNLERAWKGVTREFKNAMQAMGDWGRNDLQVQLEAAEAALRTQESRWRAQGIDPSEQRGVKAAQARVDALKEQVRVQGLVNDGLNAEQQWQNDTIKAIEQRREAERRAADEVDRQLQSLYGLDTAVNRLETTFASMSEERQKAMVEDGRYAELMARAMEEDAKHNTARAESSRAAVERKSEEAIAVERLLSQFQRQEASMERQIALYGDTSRAAAMAYDIQTAGLADVDAELARVLQKNAEWLDFLDDMAALEGVWQEVAAEHAKYGEEVAGQYDFMSEHAKQAARNMQTHFANFLFDPFADGSKNMAQAFSETLRRMMAEAAASKIFEMIGGALSNSGAGWAQWLGGVIGGKREHGGPVNRGSLYQVGERNKPEILHTASGQYLIPGDHGRVEPISHAGGGGAMATPQININVAGNANVESATARQNPSGGFDIDVILRQVDSHIAGGIATGTGQTGRAMKSRYGLKEVV